MARSWRHLGDYTAAKVTNAADKGSASAQAFTGAVQGNAGFITNAVTSDSVLAAQTVPNGATGTSDTLLYTGGPPAGWLNNTGRDIDLYIVIIYAAGTGSTPTSVKLSVGGTTFTTAYSITVDAATIADRRATLLRVPANWYAQVILGSNATLQGSTQQWTDLRPTTDAPRMSTYPGTTGSQIDMKAVEALLVAALCPASWLLTLAAIPWFESGGLTNNLNNTPATGDYSVGLWQINYYGNLFPGREAAFGPPNLLAGNAQAQARAAVAILGGGPGITAWYGDPIGTAAQAGPLSWSEIESIFQAHGVPTDWYQGAGPAPPPVPGPAPEKENDMAASDPISGGEWCTDSTGAVFAYDGAPYLGGLNNHPDWHAGTATDPCVGIAYWRGADTVQNGRGYVLFARSADSAAPAPYRFPRDGSLAKPS